MALPLPISTRIRRECPGIVRKSEVFVIGERNGFADLAKPTDETLRVSNRFPDIVFGVRRLTADSNLF